MTIRKRIVLFSLGLFLAALPLAAQTGQITLLHVSDSHSHLDAWGPKDGNLDATLGGIAKAAFLVAAERTADPNALFVHAGDFMDGDVFFNDYLGAPELQLLKSMGLDALVLGNHEFRLGSDFLVGVLQSAWPDGGVPILGANINPMGHALGSWITANLIKHVNGVKVGLFGVTIHKNPLLNPAPVVINKITVPLVQLAVNALRGSGAQVVICVSHAGLATMRPIAAGVAGLDVIVNGHDNAVLEQPEAIVRPDGGTDFIVSAGALYRWVGRLRLAVEGGTVSFVDYELLDADALTSPLASVQATVDALKAEIVTRYGDIYHQQLALAETDITMDWNAHNAKRDTALGNLMADAYRAWTGTDIAIEPFAYLGDALPAGPIVGADVFRAMSYGSPSPWKLVTFNTTGAALRHALDTTLTLGGDFFPQVSGLRFDYDSTATELYGDVFGSKRLILVDTMHVGGQKLLDDQIYSVTATDGVYQALRYMLMMPMTDIQKWPDRVFEATRLYVAQAGELGLATSNRIRDVAAIPRALKAVIHALR
ncbi:MAG TPA: 5'-nucleotidase C-terminal domain-containing protein [Acidobacteriota bacterium]|nr:5'-nucleotidase C-terminal domain-containing protein [Acidobacteriota bacterium]